MGLNRLRIRIVTMPDLPREGAGRPLFTPRTELGKRLSVLRTKAVLGGMKLLSEDEVLEEVKRRRGELSAESQQT